MARVVDLLHGGSELPETNFHERGGGNYQSHKAQPQKLIAHCFCCTLLASQSAPHPRGISPALEGSNAHAFRATFNPHQPPGPTCNPFPLMCFMCILEFQCSLFYRVCQFVCASPPLLCLMGASRDGVLSGLLLPCHERH